MHRQRGRKGLGWQSDDLALLQESDRLVLRFFHAVVGGCNDLGFEHRRDD